MPLFLHFIRQHFWELLGLGWVTKGDQKNLTKALLTRSLERFQKRSCDIITGFEITQKSRIINKQRKRFKGIRLKNLYDKPG